MMTIEEILNEHPGLKKENVKIYESDSSREQITIDKIFSCASLIWDRDEGNMAVMKATSYVDVRVDHIRKGKWNGAIYVAMAPGDELKLRQNLDDLNYDAFSC